MIFLIFLLVVGGWFLLSVLLARRIPRWLGIERHAKSASFAFFVLLLVAPAVQDIVGMLQFERLCKERAVVWVSPEAGQVTRAKKTSPSTVELPGYWIAIRLQREEYSDSETGRPFLAEVGLHTKGGFVGGIASLGNTHSCWPKDGSQIFKNLNIDKLLEQGKRS